MFSTCIFPCSCTSWREPASRHKQRWAVASVLEPVRARLTRNVCQLYACANLKTLCQLSRGAVQVRTRLAEGGFPIVPFPGQTKRASALSCGLLLPSCSSGCLASSLTCRPSSPGMCPLWRPQSTRRAASWSVPFSNDGLGRGAVKGRGLIRNHSIVQWSTIQYTSSFSL